MSLKKIKLHHILTISCLALFAGTSEVKAKVQEDEDQSHIQYNCVTAEQFKSQMDKAYDEIEEKYKGASLSILRQIFAQTSLESQQVTLLAPHIFQGQLFTAGAALNCWADLRTLVETDKKNRRLKRERLTTWKRCVENFYDGALPEYGQYLYDCLRK